MADRHSINSRSKSLFISDEAFQEYLKATEARRAERDAKWGPRKAATRARAKEINKARATANIPGSPRGHYTADDVREILRLQGGLCRYCRCDLKREEWQVDHIIPLSRGGSNWPWNIAVACERCNRRKGRKTPEEWLGTDLY